MNYERKWVGEFQHDQHLHRKIGEGYGNICKFYDFLWGKGCLVFMFYIGEKILVFMSHFGEEKRGSRDNKAKEIQRDFASEEFQFLLEKSTDKYLVSCIWQEKTKQDVKDVAKIIAKFIVKEI
jgi:hypothetical protein